MTYQPDPTASAIPPDALTSPDDSIRQLNSLLRGEISAAETYRMAIDKIADGSQTRGLTLLKQIQEEHAQACQSLRDRISELGGQASDSSGAWGTWAKTVQGTMNLFGDASALKGLKEGEEHGLKDYQEALAKVDPTTAQMIQNQLIPRQELHLGLLDQILGSVGRD